MVDTLDSVQEIMRDSRPQMGERYSLKLFSQKCRDWADCYSNLEVAAGKFQITDESLNCMNQT
jgi:hypothetical protein